MYGYDIIHLDIVNRLIENTRQDMVHHAYIFEGEKGVGALNAAKLFAQALVCEHTQNSPCCVCDSCVMAKELTHPDIYYVKPPEGKKNISVDMIREVTKDAYTKPYESGRKVYIITYGDELNEQAQNAFLKLLEEPPLYAVFIILVQNHEALLQTIRSRCTLINFAPASEKTVKEYLQKKFTDCGDKIDFLIKYADGNIEKAENILAQENFIPLRAEAFDKLSELLSDNLLSAYSICDFLEENKEDADLIFRFWLGFTRDIMLIQCGMKNSVSNSDFIDRMINASFKISETRIICAEEQIILAQKMKQRYVNLHTLILKMAFTIKNTI